MVIASFHTHSKPARVSFSTNRQLLDLVDYSLANNVGVVAVTDHEWVYGVQESERQYFSTNLQPDQKIDQRINDVFDVGNEFYSAKDLGDMRVVRISNGLKTTYFLRGQEFHTPELTESGIRHTHILGFGYDGDLINDGKYDPVTMVEKIQDHGGIAIVPHPYNIVIGGVKHKSLKAMVDNESLPDAIEGFNAQNVLLGRICDRASQVTAARMGIPWVANSDAHRPWHMKLGYVDFPDKVYRMFEGQDSDDVVDLLRLTIAKGYYSNCMQGIAFNDFVDWWTGPQGNLVDSLAGKVQDYFGKN